MGYSRQSLMKHPLVNGINVYELVFVPEINVLSTCFNFRLSGRWTAVGISYKTY